MRIESLSQMPSNFPELGRNKQSVVSSEGQNTYNGILQQVNEKKLGALIERGNQVLEKTETRLEVSFHELTNQMMVKLVDTQTNEVVKEIPPEKWLDLVYNLCEQMGLFIDTKLG
ncbi:MULTISPECIES: flagellar protein FlaG [Paenibacillus]|jgi:flagellar protein FlaG|uniref:flagellar protein FlaG n=1 Tax=Paenibacillus TaxID=44249 RepID=UPI000561F808|nr:MULTISPECIES: flagellar protein FlaG [Paenibacillus]MCI1774337.1 flagellar protein FlaG [Paenibacillus lautus]VTR39405.1 flagellar protein FlaG [Actinobacillus pleuropneumoniae]